MANYIRQYLRNFRVTGSIVPSSRFLTRKMLKPVDFSKAKVIVELGSGDGCMTKKILAKMRKDAKLYAIELQSDFVKMLKAIDDKRLVVIQDTAERTHSLTPKADYIISGLPLTSLPKRVGENIIQSVLKTLKPNGSYIQFQYTLISYKKFKELFSDVKLSFTPLNFPPAFVYACTK